ncbi:hypothetical protein Gohar_028372, partial [Gossypium harknessii]|nr:hypothetical protein [Gossypium harknessii]
MQPSILLVEFGKTTTQVTGQGILGLPIRRKLFKWVLMVVMSVAIAAMVFAYAVSLVPLTSDPAYSWLLIRLWTIFMILLFAAQEVRLMIKIFKFVGNLIMRFINW